MASQYLDSWEYLAQEEWDFIWVLRVHKRRFGALLPSLSPFEC